MSSNGNNCSPHGFTMVEVAVAIAISALTVLPAATMLADVQNATTQNERVMEAGFLARSMMERYVKNCSPVIERVGSEGGISYHVFPSTPGESDATISAQVDVTIPDGDTITLVTVVKK